MTRTKYDWAVGIILLVSLLVRLINLGTPQTYYFDEVYHAVTAKAYANNDPAGYEWWHEAPEPGTAYEWLHPPLGKVFMALGWKYLGQSAWAWRIPGVLFGVALIWLTYRVALLLLKKPEVAVTAALLAALDGLLLAQSRIGMNDIYVAWFMLAAVGSYVKARELLPKSPLKSHNWLLLSGILAGLAMSTKWSGVFTLGIIATLELQLGMTTGLLWIRRWPRLIITFVFIPVLIYFASYGQFWLQGHTWAQFVELHNQIWWYQTHLEATHSYQSKAWEWPLMIRPVWYHVNYLDSGRIANIYNTANPIILWSGLIAIVSILLQLPYRSLTTLKSLSPLLVVVIAYMWSWMPWLLSPRIMFFYHYAPAVPWLCIAFAYLLWNLGNSRLARYLRYGWISLTALAFVWLSPMWLAIPLPESWWKYLFWLPTWK